MHGTSKVKTSICCGLFLRQQAVQQIHNKSTHQSVVVTEFEHYDRRTCSRLCVRWVYSLDGRATARRPSQVWSSTKLNHRWALMTTPWRSTWLHGNIFTARAMLSRYMPWSCVCLCVSVTSQCSTKIAKHRKTQITPYDSPGTLVFWCQKSFRNSTGVTPNGGAKCRWGRVKSANFDK